VRLVKVFMASMIVFGLPSLMPLTSQAEHAVKNGCGDDAGLARLVPNAPAGASFERACNNHDGCYGELNQSKDYCDERFHSEMLDKCESTFNRAITRPLRATCNGMANIYYLAVSNSGSAAESYRKSQAHARQEAFR
jgi:hypothetical protein